MAASLNRAEIIGHLGRDPETRNTNDGRKIVTLSVATSESWKDKAGKKQEKTEWHNIVIFNQGLAEIAEKYLRKGTLVRIEGAIKTRKWEDNSGNERYTTEIVLAAYSGSLLILSSNSKGDDAGSYQRHDQAPPLDEADSDILF